MDWRPPKSCLLPLHITQTGLHSLDSPGETRALLLPTAPVPRAQPLSHSPATRTAGITAVPAFAWIQSLCPRDNSAVKVQPSTHQFYIPPPPPPHFHNGVGDRAVKVAPEKLKKLLQRSSKLVIGAICVSHLQPQSSQASASPGEIQPCSAAWNLS